MVLPSYIGGNHPEDFGDQGKSLLHFFSLQYK